jgi:hypothetical protein
MWKCFLKLSLNDLRIIFWFFERRGVEFWRGEMYGGFLLGIFRGLEKLGLEVENLRFRWVFCNEKLDLKTLEW